MPRLTTCDDSDVAVTDHNGQVRNLFPLPCSRTYGCAPSYTNRVAISNSRLIALDDKGVTFRWKDYRARGEAPGEAWIKPMTLAADEFIRRFLLHVLPSGFHRIRPL